MPLLVDRALAARLERAEGALSASFVEARAAVEPSVGAAWREIGGAFALFDGPESMMTQTFGLGTRDAVDDALLGAIEAFFGERGAATQHEICPLAGVETTAKLVARGYAPTEMSNVLVRAVDDDVPAPPVAPRVRVRVAVPSDERAWTEAFLRGWDMGPSFEAMLQRFARITWARSGMTHFLAELDGEPVGIASLGIADGVAVFAGASTIPSARRNGAQGAFMSARVAHARARGCEVAMMAAEPGSTSQHNAERSGFRVAYTRTKWMRAAR